MNRLLYGEYTKYGLAASIFTNDISKGHREVSKIDSDVWKIPDDERSRPIWRNERIWIGREEV